MEIAIASSSGRGLHPNNARPVPKDNRRFVLPLVSEALLQLWTKMQLSPAMLAVLVLLANVLAQNEPARAQSTIERQAACELSAIRDTRSPFAIQLIRSACNWLAFNSGSLLNEGNSKYYGTYRVYRRIRLPGRLFQLAARPIRCDRTQQLRGNGRVTSKASHLFGTAQLYLVSRVSPVHTAMRNCTRDEGGPFEVGNQVLTR